METLRNYGERILEIMRLKNITKSELAEGVGVKKQNVNVLLETNNVEKLKEIAKALDITLSELVEERKEASEVKGYIEYQGTVHIIKSKEDIENLLTKIE